MVHLPYLGVSCTQEDPSPPNIPPPFIDAHLPLHLCCTSGYVPIICFASSAIIVILPSSVVDTPTTPTLTSVTSCIHSKNLLAWTCNVQPGKHTVQHCPWWRTANYCRTCRRHEISWVGMCKSNQRATQPESRTSLSARQPVDHRARAPSV